MNFLFQHTSTTIGLWIMMIMMMMITTANFIVTLLPVVVYGWEVCDDGTICPDGNICCGNNLCMSNVVNNNKNKNNINPISSAATTDDIGTATCCTDDTDDDDRHNKKISSLLTNTATATTTTTTGCRPNYSCSKNDTTTCTIDTDIDNTDHLPSIIPRNQLCTVSSSMMHIYALPIPTTATTMTSPTTTIVDDNNNNNDDNNDSDNDNNQSIFRPWNIQHSSSPLRYQQQYYYPFRRRNDSRNDRKMKKKTMISNSNNNNNNNNKIPVGTFITTSSVPFHDDHHIFDSITHIVLLIHGSRRNVEDYLCCTVRAATTATEMMNEGMNKENITIITDPNSILFIAPWFPTKEDGMINITTISNQENISDQFDILRWIGDTNSNHDNNHDPFRVNHIFHTWRYGAGSINYPNISSYDIMDIILSNQYIYNTTKFPNVQNIILTGHSAGGQYVQRYTLLSNHIRTNNDNRNHHHHHYNNTAVHHPQQEDVVVVVPNFRTVVANPKSYAYLDARRWMVKTNTRSSNNSKLQQQQQQQRNTKVDSTKHIDDNNDMMEFRIPHPNEIVHCPTYNKWEWGLEYNVSSSSSQDDDDDDDTVLIAPYVQKIIDSMNGNISNIVQRYLTTREVIYLSGEQDQIYNGDCNDHIQGPNRYIRSERYYNAIQLILYNNDTNTTNNNNNNRKKIQHDRVVVPNVPHDHCLMYQSVQGVRALFGVAIQP